MEVQGGFRGAAPPPRKTRLREFDRFRYRGTRTAKAFLDRTYRSHKTYFESRSKDQETDTKKAGICPTTHQRCAEQCRASRRHTASGAEEVRGYARARKNAHKKSGLLSNQETGVRSFVLRFRERWGDVIGITSCRPCRPFRPCRRQPGPRVFPSRGSR